MAGLKKSKKDTSSPNMVLVIFLIFFVMVSIGLGIFAYYGYDGQDKLRIETKNAEAKAKTFKLLRDQEFLARMEGMVAIGVEPTPEELAQFKAASTEFTQKPDDFKDVEKAVKEMRAKNSKFLGVFSEAEMKYPTTYEPKTAAAIAEAIDSKSKLDTVKTEYEVFKKNYDSLVAKYEKDIDAAQAAIAAGNKAAFGKSSEVNTMFPKIQAQLKQREEDIKQLNDKLTKEIEDRDNRIAKQNNEMDSLKKRLDDRLIGTGSVAASAGSGSTEVGALMLDISRGFPLWDRPLGKIVRVDPSNLLVYIDIGASRGAVAELTFQVFTGTANGQADRKLKGTLEIVRVINDSNSVCKITSLYDDNGDPISLASGDARMRALRESDNILKEGDLLFNTFFDSHVALVGNINFLNFGGESAATQNLQLQEFMQLLRKQRITVDAYVNLLNGQIEGTITPRTRLLIRGDLNAINRNEDEQSRVKLLVDAYLTMRKQAIDQGMFIISAENFAAVIGYRPPQSQLSKEQPIGFRPLVPFVNNNGPRIARPDVVGPAPALDAPAEKKDAEMKKDADK